jgi:isoleucyl-tRNA synthetase
MQKSDTEDSIKVRQPLLKLTYTGEKLDQELEDIIAEEVHVKTVEFVSGSNDPVWLDKTLTPELKREGLMREVVRNVQSARKQAGLQIDDRIKLSLVTEDAELANAIEEHRHTICDETLATGLVDSLQGQKYTSEVKIDGISLTITIEKA